MFGRATIRFGIDPHSSFHYFIGVECKITVVVWHLIGLRSLVFFTESVHVSNGVQSSIHVCPRDEIHKYEISNLSVTVIIIF